MELPHTMQFLQFFYEKPCQSDWSDEAVFPILPQIKLSLFWTSSKASRDGGKIVTAIFKGCLLCYKNATSPTYSIRCRTMAQDWRSTLWKVEPKAFNFVVRKSCQSSPSLTILVPLWFIIISLVFFFLCKAVFVQFNGNFVDGQTNSKYRDCTPLSEFENTEIVRKFLSPS